MKRKPPPPQEPSAAEVEAWQDFIRTQTRNATMGRQHVAPDGTPGTLYVYGDTAAGQAFLNHKLKVDGAAAARDRKRQRGASKGGKERAKNLKGNADTAAQALQREAEQIVRQGHSPRDVGRILAERKGVTPDAIRKRLRARRRQRKPST